MDLISLHPKCWTIFLDIFKLIVVCTLDVCLYCDLQIQLLPVETQ